MPRNPAITLFRRLTQTHDADNYTQEDIYSDFELVTMFNLWVPLFQNDDFPTPAAFNAAVRNKTRALFFSSARFKGEVLSLANLGRTIVFIDFLGKTYDAEGNEDHPYITTIASSIAHNKRELMRTLNHSFSEFRPLRKSNRPGYIKTGRKVVIERIRIHVFQRPYAGGARPKTQPKRLTIDSHILSDVPNKIGYSDASKNNCFLRALYTQMPSKVLKEDFKKKHRPNHVRQSEGIQKDALFPLKNAFDFCDRNGIELVVYLPYRSNPDSPMNIKLEKTLSPNHDTTSYLIKDVRLSLYEDHYWIIAEGRINPTEESSPEEFHCSVCFETCPLSEARQHTLIHQINEQEGLEDWQPPTEKFAFLEGETEEEASERYAEYYVGICKDYIEHRDNYRKLWLAGPGGCGKSFVINKLRDSYATFEDLNKHIFCLSHTGVASQNIEGKTIESFLSASSGFIKAYSEEGGCNVDIIIVIDELSTMSVDQLQRLDRMLKMVYIKRLGQDYRMIRGAPPFGGFKVIYMGDFLQLEPVKGDIITTSDLFMQYTDCVPLTFGWRYRSHPEYYEFLLKLQQHYVSIREWIDIGFKTITTNELIHNFTPESRPSIISAYKDPLKEITSKILRKDKIGRDVIRNPVCFKTISPIEEDNRHNLLHFQNVMEWIGDSKFEILISTQEEQKKLRNMTFVEAVYDKEDNPLYFPEFDCEIDVKTEDYYIGQPLMVLVNSADARSRGASGELRNGQIVKLKAIDAKDSIMIVEDTKGGTYYIPQRLRGIKSKNGTYLAYGFPVAPAISFSAHKAQGKTLPAIAVMLPTKFNKNTWNNIYYVILSRCISARNVYFIVDTMKDASEDEKLAYVYRMLYNTDGKGVLHIHPAEPLADIMNFTRDNTDLRDFTGFDQCETPEDHRTFSFPKISGLQRFEPTLETAFSRKYPKEKRYSFLLNNTIFFDDETGASEGNDIRFFDVETGQFINTCNTDRLNMSEYQCCIRHYKNGRVVWCREHEELEPFVDYQREDGYIIFQRGEYDDDESDGDPKWVSMMVFCYILYVCTMWSKEHEKDKNVENVNNYLFDMPIYLVGFNIDSFDIKTILQRFTDTKVVKYYPHIIPNNGHSITQLMIKDDKKRTVLATHDIYTLLGRGARSLSKTHESYVLKTYNTNEEQKKKFKDILSLYTPDAQEIEHMMAWMEGGKDYFPHLLTQREGHRAALVNEMKTYKLEDFPRRDWEELTNNPERLTFNIYKQSQEYNKKDIMTTILCYISKDYTVVNELNITCLKINTAQQYTMRNFMQNGKSVVITDSITKRGRTKYNFDTFLMRNHEQIINKGATYGGKTLPRVVYFDAERSQEKFTQVDQSGMYAAALANNPYPYGKHYYCVLPSTLQRVMSLWDEVKASGDPRRLADPRGTSFPFMFMGEFVLKMPSLIMDPGVGYRPDDSKGDIYWSICEEGGDGIVTKKLTCVDLAHEMAQGAELLEIKTIIFWEKIGHIFETYVDDLNTRKNSAKDEVEKEECKLAANAFYGATLKKDHNTIFVIYDSKHPERYTKLNQKINWSVIHTRVLYKNGSLGIQADAKVDPTAVSSRPNYWGAFVLSWSKYDLGEFVRLGYGDTFNPTTLSDVRDALLNGPLYGDTDSLFISHKHVNRIMDWQKDKPWEKYWLAVKVPEGKHPKTKTGKFLDECANDSKSSVPTHWESLTCTSILKFGCNAPKSYCTEYKLADGRVKYKNRLKGIYGGGSKIVVDDKDLIDDEKKLGKRPFQYFETEEEYEAAKQEEKRQKIEAYRAEAIAYRHQRLLSSTDIYGSKCKTTFEKMWECITNETKVLRTYAPGRLKNFGAFPQRFELDVNTDGKISRRQPYDFSATGMTRDVCGETLTRRRQLTSDEIEVLGLSEYDAMRLLVPFGWNYDGALFTLPQ